MEQKEQRLAKILNIAKYEAQPSLEENIWASIVRRNKFIIKVKLFVFSFVGAVSLVSLIPTIRALSNDLLTSGVFDYISIAFSSNGSILSFWRELSLSIVESLPLMSIALSMGLLLVLFLSTKHVVRQITKNQLSILL